MTQGDVGNETYRVIRPMLHDERWEFPPDSIVQLSRKTLSNLGERLVAVSL